MLGRVPDRGGPVIPLAAYLAMVVSVAALACGHQGEPFPPLRWWRAARGAAGLRKPVKVPLAPELHSIDSRPAMAAERRSEPHSRPAAPTWARTDKDAA